MARAASQAKRPVLIANLAATKLEVPDVPDREVPLTNQISFSSRQVVALTVLMVLAFTGSLGMAFNIDAIAISFAVGNSAAGIVASIEMMAIAMGTLLIGVVAAKMPASRIYLIGLCVVVATNALSVLVHNVVALTALRVPSGLALGAIVATVMATAARSNRPESTFGIINASVGAMGIVSGFVLPRALHLHEFLPLPTQVAGLYLVYALFSLGAFALLRAVPVAPPIEVQPGTQPVSFPARRWLGLLGVGVLFFGHGLLGIFIVNLGRSIGMTPEVTGYAMMIGAVLGVVAPLLAGQLGTRVAALLWVMTLTLAIALCAVLLASAKSSLAFFIAAPIYGVLPMALLPVFLGALARVDTTGRLASAHPAFILVGGAAAPFIGGALSDAGGYLANAAGVVACAAVGALLMWGDLRSSDARRSHLVHAL